MDFKNNHSLIADVDIKKRHPVATVLDAAENLSIKSFFVQTSSLSGITVSP